jgi:dihydroxyacetone kinase
VNALLDGLQRSAKAVLDAADELNRLDGVAGDGDMGVTMSIAAKSVTTLLPDLSGQSTADVLRACGAQIARDAPSTSGTLVAVGLLSAARAAGDAADADASQLLRAAADGIAARGGAAAGEKTMLDALLPAADAAANANGASTPAALRAAAQAAADGADETARMAAKHGRAGWLADRSAGHPDPGARLVAIVLSAAADIDARELPE